MTFDDLVFGQRGGLPGIQARYQFDNGYAVSVIRGFGSYGNEQGLYELAVTTHEGSLVYDTPVTDDVIGYLPPEGVTHYMAKVAALPKRIEP